MLWVQAQRIERAPDGALHAPPPQALRLPAPVPRANDQTASAVIQGPGGTKLEEEIVTKPMDISIDEPVQIGADDLSEPLTYPVDAFLSHEYLEREKDRLWPKVWQHAGRVEELKDVGDYITYEVGDDSIVIFKTA